MEKKKDENRRYRDAWRTLRFLFGGAIRHVFAFSGEVVEPAVSPYLVVCNHNTDLDPVLIGTCFRKQMFFVASEHVFRKGLPSKLLTYLFNPISRTKGATDAAAALDIIRSLRKGNNVCLFAEGNRSFNGVTGPIFPATGKLAKASGAALITYRFEGGYLTTPRWAYTRRRGRMRGGVVNVYTPEQLKAMTPDEVNAAIAQDLFEDAFQRQLENPCDYVGKRLAEGLENALFICPRCGKIGTLKSRDDKLTCGECGMTATYNVRGFFDDDAPYATVRDWDAWQQKQLAALYETAGDAPLFSDAGMRLLEIGDSHAVTTVATGTLSMYRDRITLSDVTFLIQEVSNMAQVGSSRIVFTSGGKHYEIASDAPHYCGLKYHMLYRIIKK